MTLYDAVTFALVFALSGIGAVSITATAIMAHEWWTGKR